MSNIVQTAWATGQRVTPRPQTAGNTHNVLIKVDLSAVGITAATDIVEIGVLPAFARPVDAELWSNGTFTGVLCDIGILTGDAGDKVSITRALTTDLFFDDADLAAASTAAVELGKAGVQILASDKDRGIGMTVSANVAAAAGKYVLLSLSYVQ